MVRKARSGIEGSNREVLIAVGLELGNRAFLQLPGDCFGVGG